MDGHMNGHHKRIKVLSGDITAMRVEAIVNAANSSLLGGGGVDGAIHRAGGAEILEACRAIRRETCPRGLPTGQAVHTTAGKLPARYVIHTVGPVWKDGHSGEPELLSAAYRNSLELAARLELKTLAFPAISTGVYGYPPEKAARVVWETLNSWLPGQALPETVYLVFFSPGARAAFTRAIPEAECL